MEHATAPSASDDAYQTHILQDVSRTFALTIPELPADLSRVVSNGYLLCRIADTVEDEPTLSPEQKRHFSELFINVVAGEASAANFADELYPRLSEQILVAEKDLIHNTPAVLRITHSFNSVQRRALQRCVRIMSLGMAEFQENEPTAGLESLPDLDRYCYHVAGVVGEMLTEVFCDYSEAVERHRAVMMKLAVSFGQGLQMTNILKDVWEDRKRGVCWLPRDVFREFGFDLSDLSPENHGAGFRAGMDVLIGVARLHLRNALRYTLMLPKHETGIRRFCLWALGMAVLTLRKIHRHPDFSAGKQVKITRSSVKATVAVTSATARHDPALRLLFNLFTRSLPAPEDDRGILLVT